MDTTNDYSNQPEISMNKLNHYSFLYILWLAWMKTSNLHKFLAEYKDLCPPLVLARLLLLWMLLWLWVLLLCLIMVYLIWSHSSGPWRFSRSFRWAPGSSYSSGHLRKNNHIISRIKKTIFYKISLLSSVLAFKI